MNNSENRFVAIIPARWASSRFPGKPLALLGGMTVIERVWRRVSAVVERVLVATDDERIARVVNDLGGEAVMTRADHRSGTDRCREAYLNAACTENVVINVQGDEPFISPEQIETLKRLFRDPSTDIGTLVKPFPRSGSVEALANPNRPKVVIGVDGRALYFSRQVIPHLRGVDASLWHTRTQYYTHIGMYAYRADVLARVTSLEQSPLELAESLEQLRWLENGLVIRTGITDIETIGIDTPDDLAAAEQYLLTHNIE